MSGAAFADVILHNANFMRRREKKSSSNDVFEIYNLCTWTISERLSSPFQIVFSCLPWKWVLLTLYTIVLHHRFTPYLLTFYTFSENAALKQIINSLFQFSAGHYCYWTEQILLRFLIFLLISSDLLSADFHASRGLLTVLCSSILLTSTILLFASGFLAKPETNSD